MIIPFTQFLRQRFGGTSTGRIKKIILEQADAAEIEEPIKKEPIVDVNTANANEKVPEYAIRWLTEEDESSKTRLELVLAKYFQPQITGMAGKMRREKKYRFAQQSPITEVDIASFVITNLFKDVNRFGAVTDWSKMDEKEITSSYNDRLKPEYGTDSWKVDKRWLGGITLDGTCPDSYRCIIARWYSKANGDMSKLSLESLWSEVKKSVSIMCSHYWYGVIRGQEERLQDDTQWTSLDTTTGGESGEWVDREQSAMEKLEDTTPVGTPPDKYAEFGEKDPAYVDFFTGLSAYVSDWLLTQNDIDQALYQKVFDTVIACVRNGVQGFNASRPSLEKKFYEKAKQQINVGHDTWQEIKSIFDCIIENIVPSYKDKTAADKEHMQIDFFEGLKPSVANWIASQSDIDKTLYKKVFDTVIALVRSGEPGFNSLDASLEENFYEKVKQKINEGHNTWQDIRFIWNYIVKEAAPSYKHKSDGEESQSYWDLKKLYN